MKLLATRPACLLLPSTWARHSAPLEILTERRNHPQVTQAVKRLQERNNRLLQTTKNKTVVSHTRAGQVYCILDSVNYNSAVRIEELSYECIEVISDGTQLIAVLLQWACSYYRRGPHRAFLATRLLRKWSQLGADIYEGVISYLRNMSWIGNGDPNIIFKIVGELVRSKTFAAGRYLQWLIATGSLVHDTDLPSVSIILFFIHHDSNEMIAHFLALTSDHGDSVKRAFRSDSYITKHSLTRNPACYRTGTTSSRTCPGYDLSIITYLVWAVQHLIDVTEGRCRKAELNSEARAGNLVA